MKIAAVCMHSETGEIERNLDRTEQFVSKASGLGAQLICFPELSLTGYTLNNPLDIYAGLPPDKVVKRVDEMAKGKALIVIAGFIEPSDGQKPFISQIVAGPDGLLGIYRKTHLSPQERERYEAGERIEVFRHGPINFGIQLCYEAHFPEISTVMALKGAEAIFMPHASPRGTPEEKTQSWLRHLPGRAFDNGLFVVACNQAGSTREGFTFPGVALALDPMGNLITRYAGEDEEMLIADLKRDQVKEVRGHRLRYFIPHRRPELYKRLTSTDP